MIERILFNGNIITLDATQPRATAVAIAFGRIVAVGMDSDILELASSKTIKENLNNKTVIPGLTDAHLHWEWTSRALREVDVFEVPTKQVALERVAERAREVPEGDWITGYGWTQDFWPDRQFPTAADLDSVAPNSPVVLRAKSGHAIWVNSETLRRANITPDTPDPEGGQIGRDHNGKLTGILFETAEGLITKHIPELSEEEIVERMKSAQKLALASGLTGFHDFDGPTCMNALQILRERGELHMRVLKNVNDTWIEHAHALKLRWGFGDEWIRIGGLKIFADGALGPRTALMVDPYENEPENYGIKVNDKETMQQLVSKASAAGLPATIHAIGDRAVHDVLDVYESVRAEEKSRGETPSQRRHRIEHVQIIHPDDIDRLAKLDIIASMQPIHATSDYQMADSYWGARSQYAYNPRIQLDRGVTVAFGSDSPVDPFDPLAGIYAAITRRRPDGSPGPEGWYPEAKVTLMEALYGWTTGPAYAADMENQSGRIAQGYLADLVVLNQDLFKIPAEDILNTQVLATMVNGEWRHGEI